ncbi:MAG: undecaprenyl/decaprenyl-phosphate alpha-N-acetylglucosaminyl 1-phosphate transferase [Deltaproteobacteria bacterium]|nr:undecaprenyl/decaprenyl-phosphate alpha-N-acetylglucosaminyl 1-phosphate transferase [Deltaproteobacteria bacterium]
MLSYLCAFGVAFVVAAVVAPLVARVAHRYQLIDQPDAVRKLHGRAVPRLGGIAVVLAFLTPIAALATYDNDIALALQADATRALAFGVGSLSIVALGIFDDVRGTDARQKFAVQLLVAGAMWAAGFRIEEVGGSLGFAVDLGWLSLPMTVVWIVGVVNAVNLIDGLDGLASGIALAATLVLLAVAFAGDQVLLVLLMAALAGALVGFLIFNFNPARIFLGDSGSLFLGFVLAVGSLWTHQKASTAVTVLLIPLFALAVPLIDTTLCIVRRVARNQNPFSPDREHLHHRLMALGHSHRSAVLTLWGVAGVFGLAAVEMLDDNPVRRGFAVVAAIAIGALLVWRVGVFGVVPISGKKLVVRARSIATKVRAAPNLDTAWREVEAVLPTLGCNEVRLEIRDGRAAVRTLVWNNRDVAPADQAKRSVLRLPVGRRDVVGELKVTWNKQPTTAPMHAARKKALRSLHVALSDLQQPQRQLIHSAGGEPALWGTKAQPAGRAVLD